MENQLKTAVKGIAFLQQVFHHTDLRNGKDQIDIADFLINNILENRNHGFRVSKGAQVGIFINYNHKRAWQRIEIGKYVSEALKVRGEGEYQQFSQQTSKCINIFLHSAFDAFIVNYRLILLVQRFPDQPGFPDTALTIHEGSASCLLHGSRQL